MKQARIRSRFTPRLSRARRQLVVLAVTAAVLVAAAPVALAGDRGAVDPQPDKAGKPTVVLVHGAWADGSSWSAVVRDLTHDGYSVRVPPNPLRSLAGDSATLAAFLGTITGPVVLVGHSYGGAVITDAATGNPDVKALVYVDAFAPLEGETIFPLVGPDSALAADPATIFDFVPYPDAPAGDVDLYLKRDIFVKQFANGLPRREADLLYATQRPLAFSAGNQASGPAAWMTIPSWYVVGTKDLIIPPSAQLFMARRAGSTITKIRAGHLGLISDPGAVTRVIERAARSTD